VHDGPIAGRPTRRWIGRRRTPSSYHDTTSENVVPKKTPILSHSIGSTPAQ
jgi:hypothetical protein